MRLSFHLTKRCWNCGEQREQAAFVSACSLSACSGSSSYKQWSNPDETIVAGLGPLGCVRHHRRFGRNGQPDRHLPPCPPLRPKQLDGRLSGIKRTERAECSVLAAMRARRLSSSARSAPRPCRPAAHQSISEHPPSALPSSASALSCRRGQAPSI